jgi:hypothetical protein
MTSFDLRGSFGAFVSARKIPFPGRWRLRFEETGFEGALPSILMDWFPPKPKKKEIFLNWADGYSDTDKLFPYQFEASSIRAAAPSW